jgi:carboxylesterase type B
MEGVTELMPVVYGTKEEFGMYDPTGLIKASKNRFIWVASNYRLGAYGWLAGTTMERESSPNVGLYGDCFRR